MNSLRRCVLAFAAVFLWLPDGSDLPWVREADGYRVSLPPAGPDQPLRVVRLER